MKLSSHSTQDVEKINQQFREFLSGLQYTYAERLPQYEEEIQGYLQSLRLWPNQFVYVHHIKSGKFYHKGFDNALGYDIKDLTADVLIRNLHPADLTMYFKISKALLSFVVDNSDGLVPFDSSFQVNYRLKKANGEYIQVVRQSTPFIIKDGVIEAYISLCSEITSISDSNSVKWSISGPRKEFFDAYINEYDEEEEALFSGRELDVLKLLSKGMSSAKISEKLFISINTVNTHRKNLMRKANVNKSIDLISFAIDNGYL